MSKQKVIYKSGEQGGYQWRTELDLSQGDFQSSIIPPSVIEFSRFYVYVRTSGATGIGGQVEIKQGPDKNPSTHDTTPLGTINLAADGQGSTMGDIHGGYLSVNLPAGLPVVGKMEIIVIAKDS